ncbi:MAG: S-layer homology domain-containing protein [Clostridia bacterium]|nr:S-layer homology domain-containing protein [Clostridia bacterium]
MKNWEKVIMIAAALAMVTGMAGCGSKPNKADAEALVLDFPQRITADSISLPESGIFGSTITWSFTPNELISDDYTVIHKSSDKNVTLIAEVKSGSVTELKRFLRTISGTSNGSSGTGSGGAGSGGTGNRGSRGGGTVPSLPSQPTTHPAEPTEIFVDLGEVTWAKTAILDLCKKEIVNGKEAGKFQPLDDITREEYVKMLVLAFGFETVNTGDFTDVNSGEWYAAYVGGAVKAGIVNGIGDGLFGIGQKITRQDMAVMTLRAAEAAQKTLAHKEAQRQFEDQTQIAEYALNAVGILQTAGILNGDENGYFNPKANANRAAAAKILYSLLAAEDENGGHQ